MYLVLSVAVVLVKVRFTSFNPPVSCFHPPSVRELSFLLFCEGVLLVNSRKESVVIVLGCGRVRRSRAEGKHVKGLREWLGDHVVYGGCFLRGRWLAVALHGHSLSGLCCHFDHILGAVFFQPTPCWENTSQSCGFRGSWWDLMLGAVSEKLEESVEKSLV